MRVRHYSFSNTGGAGTCASLIVEAQRAIGIDAKIEFSIEGGLREWRSVISHPKLVARAAIDEFLIKKSSVPSLVSLTRSSGVAHYPFFSVDGTRGDIVHLHWIEGMISLDDIDNYLQSGGRVVWTLHDMAPITGVCHFSLDCEGFSKTCAGCPQVRRLFNSAVRKRLESKVDLFDKHRDKLLFTAPSAWMKKTAENSRALGGREVALIPNPVSQLFFEEPKGSWRRECGISAQSFVIALVAENLGNPVKRVEFLIKLLASSRFAQQSEITLLLVGASHQDFGKQPFQIVKTGSLSAHSLAEALSTANLLVSVSLAESAGMTIKEAAAMGIPSLILEGSGSSTTVAHGVTGLVAEDDIQFLSYLKLLVSDNDYRVQLGLRAREDALNQNSGLVVARKYLEVYKDLLDSTE